MTGLRVLVTGASRGIGRAIALRFAREGANVACASRNSELLDELVAEIEAAGGRGLAVQMNVRDEGSVEAAVYRALEMNGHVLDVLVNCAGVFNIVEFEKLRYDEWQKHLEVNLTGPFMVTSEAIQGLEESERPHVFNIASVAAREAFPGNAAYCASKYGLRGLSDAMRIDLGAKNIKVTTVFPGPVDTPIWDSIPGEWDRASMNRPEDVAEVIWNTYHAGDGTEINEVDVPKPA